MASRSEEKCTTYIPVTQFYKGRSIFLTGGTGFVGKVLIFKLLKSCPDIDSIFILLRPKRGEHVSTRLSKLINGKVFDKLRDCDPSLMDKIIPIHGDVSQPNLGINESDEKTLVEKVSVIFHLAATVKFDETLKDSVSINVLGTKRLLQLCYNMRKLKALVHVSTAYSNCDRDVITEMIYPSRFLPEQVIEFVEWLDDVSLKILTPKFLGKHPNTYTFTKSLAENVISASRKHLPVAIIRPSVVLSSLCDPEPGWVDNWNGPNKIIALIGHGTLRSVMLHAEKQLDIIPVDLVANLMISAAWQIGLKEPGSLTVYNCCSGQYNPITWGEFKDNFIKALHKYPSMNLLLKPSVVCYRNRYASFISDLILHALPAIACDFILSLCGKSSVKYKLYNKFSQEIRKLEYFAVHEWKFFDYNVQFLNRALDATDKKEFLFDVTKINWSKYVDAYVFGIRRFNLNESTSTLPEARLRQQKVLWYERIVKWMSSILLLASFLLMWLRRMPYYRNVLLNTIIYTLRIMKMF